MTDLQIVEFEMLKEFVRICDILGLKYYLVCGSALGAVKYNGFIPWDDDIDVALPRPDYDRFLREANKYLPNHLFLQNYHSEPQYPMIYSKLRNSNTTYIERSSRQLKINHGIYIDIFPLDGYPETVKEQKKIERTKWLYKLKRICVFDGNYSRKVKIIRSVLRMFGAEKNIVKTIQRCERRLTEYPTESSSIWCNHGNWQGTLEYSPREHYGDGALATFEGLQVRVPERYDDYLTQKYGYWRDDLPVEEQVGHHYYTIMDTKRPYTDYIK